MSGETSILHRIQYRRSIFPVSFTGEDIPKEVLEKLLEYANYAPSHKRTQPWRFVVFRSGGLLELADHLAELYRSQTSPEQFIQKKYDDIRSKIQASGAVIAINIHYSGLVPKWEEIAAVGCAVQNLWLAAGALGLGGYWSSPGTIQQLGGFLNLKEEEECLGLFYLGHHHQPDAEGALSPVADKISWREG